MSLEQDVATARGAVDALERVCATVTGHVRDTADARRARVGSARLREDVPLLRGIAPRPVHDRHRARRGAISPDHGSDQAIASPGRRVR